jgi:hypothetical protein
VSAYRRLGITGVEFGYIPAAAKLSAARALLRCFRRHAQTPVSPTRDRRYLRLGNLARIWSTASFAKA